MFESGKSNRKRQSTATTTPLRGSNARHRFDKETVSPGIHVSPSMSIHTYFKFREKEANSELQVRRFYWYLSRPQHVVTLR